MTWWMLAELLQSVKFSNSIAPIDSSGADSPLPSRFGRGSSAGFRFRRAPVTSARCPCSSASRIVAHICLQRLPCSSKKGQSHRTASLPFDHFSETLYSSDPCTFAPTSVGEPSANLHPLSHEVFFAAISRGSTEPLRQDRRELGSQAICLNDSLVHFSEPPAAADKVRSGYRSKTESSRYWPRASQGPLRSRGLARLQFA